MTILATHFSLVLGAWRLRVRIDIDEPRHAADPCADEPAAPASVTRTVLVAPVSGN